jgi:putative transposase
VSTKRTKISEFMVAETLFKVGSKLIWLWVAIEPKNKRILALNISKERNMFVAEVYHRFGWDLWKTSSFH